MTKITKEDILKNRFIKIVEKENPNPNCPGKTRYFRIITPSREKAERFFFSKLFVFTLESKLFEKETLKELLRLPIIG